MVAHARHDNMSYTSVEKRVDWEFHDITVFAMTNFLKDINTISLYSVPYSLLKNEAKCNYCFIAYKGLNINGTKKHGQEGWG